ncbi:MAG: ECF-type riboflavin transporter substrate-binding protein [Lachnospiraceae bacterium]|nr:ECF-type riboflavin transporter substrate-binding protein [Lachnospiraceae bacterium]
MNERFGIPEIVSAGIGTALFVVLTTVQIPIGIPNTYLQPRMAILAFVAAVFGPTVGAVTGLLGHVLGDAVFYGSVSWSWVVPEAVVGIGIGIFAFRFAVMEGRFVSVGKIVLFNLVQIVANAAAWILVAPILDIIIYEEPLSKVFVQGLFAFLGNIIIIGVLATILLAAYSKAVGGSQELQKED